MTKKVDPNKTGDISELKACVWLLGKGYEVFRNVSCTGPVDLIAIRKGEILKIDVKTVVYTKDGIPQTAESKSEDIVLLYVDKNSNHCDWYLNKFYLNKRFGFKPGL